MLPRENLGLAALLNVLPQDLSPEARGAQVRIEHAGVETWLAPIWVAEGFPADVRRGLAQIDNPDLGGIPVIAGRRISIGSQELLESAGVSWVDAGGYAKIRAGDVYISRLLRASRSTERGMPWSRAASAVAEVILEWRHQRDSDDERNRVERAAQVAELTQLSYASTSRVLSVFDDNGYTAKVGAERGPSATREFLDPGGLLSDWAGHYSRALPMGPVYQFHVPWRATQQSLATVQQALDGVPWMLSGTAAAEHLAPYLTQSPELLVYVEHDQIELARWAMTNHRDVVEVETGGRIFLHPAEPHLMALMAETAPNRTAPAVRVYGDLLRLRGRAAEAAQHLRETVIGF